MTINVVYLRYNSSTPADADRARPPARLRASWPLRQDRTSSGSDEAPAPTGGDMNGQGAVLYYSSYGHVEAMAYALAEGTRPARQSM
jgi:hypothetical protein